MRKIMIVPLLLCALATGAGAAESTVFVHAGKPLAVECIGAPWREVDGCLEGAGVGGHLLAAAELGAGDFRIRATVEVRGLEGSAATVVLGGDSHFGLSGRDGKAFVEGPLFTDMAPALTAKGHVLSGVGPFEIELARTGTELVIRVDDRELHRGQVPSGPVGRFGLRPWRARMRVLELSAEGDLTPVAPTAGGDSVFVGGAEGYHTYRIPALCVAPDGSVLAFCEGRRTGSGDAGDVDLVLRRSTDGGATWGALSVLWDDGANTCGNPCPVLDRVSGTVLLLATRNLGHDTEREIIAGTSEGTRTVWILKSADAGLTWSEPTEITSAAKEDRWTWVATGPGVGIQLERGAQRGRLVIPCDHIEADTRRYYSHVILSDDHGVTWRIGGSSPRDQVNECQVVERADGGLLLNMRNYDRSRHARAVCESHDGGETWVDQRWDEALVEPICQAGLTRVGATLVFSNPASATRRQGMTLRFSHDEGRTWPASSEIHAGPAAYSCVVPAGGGEVAVLYERGVFSPYEQIAFTRRRVPAVHEDD